MKRVLIKTIKWLSAVFLLVIVAAAVFTAGYITYLRIDGKKQLEKGELIIEREEAVERNNFFTKYDVLISNGRGLQVEVFTKVPIPVPGKIPVVVLIGGVDTGRKALDLLDKHYDLMLVSMNYPYSKPEGKKGIGKLLRTITAINRAAYRTDTAIRLILDFIKRKNFVDRNRIFMVNASIAVPFGTRAVAQNREFKALALLYGYGNLYCVYKKLFKPRLKNPLLIKFVAWLATVAIPDFEPLDYIDKISPRHVLFINGKNDERIPRECIESIHRAAREPKTITWLEGIHMHPSNSSLIRKLTDLVVEWMKEKGYL